MSIEKKISEYYTAKVNQYGTTNMGVDWNSKESQILRFQQLCKILPDKNESFSIIDYGCGYGALVDYLRGLFSDFIYIGYDISEEMIKHARKLHVSNRYTFTSLKKDIKAADYLVASGIFNVKLDTNEEEWKKYILNTLYEFNRLTSKAFSFNILTAYSDEEYKKDYLYYADPLFYFDFCKKNFSKNIALLHDYNLYEFTILVRK